MKFKQSINFTLNDGEEVGDGGEGARGGRPLAKTLGDRAHHLLQPVELLGYDAVSYTHLTLPTKRIV